MAKTVVNTGTAKVVRNKNGTYSTYTASKKQGGGTVWKKTGGNNNRKKPK